MNIGTEKSCVGILPVIRPLDERSLSKNTHKSIIAFKIIIFNHKIFSPPRRFFIIFFVDARMEEAPKKWKVKAYRFLRLDS